MADRTYLLIHGGGATARFWDALLPHLARPAVAVDLPGRRGNPGDLATLTVEQEADSVIRDVQAASPDGPLVIVAHSSGGLTVPRIVTALAARVTHIVLNAASVPPEGGCGLDCMQPRHREGVELALQIAEEKGEPLFTSGPPEDPEKFRGAYGGPPLTDEQLAYVTDPERCVVDTMHHYLQPVSWAGLPEVPVTYLLTLLDRPVPADLQRQMVERLPCRAAVVELATGHIPSIVDPARFASLLP